jgi:hypothetical protein
MDFFDVWCKAAALLGICLIPLLIVLYAIYKDDNNDDD